MTIRTTTLGGTDWVDGEVLYAADQNDTITATVGLVPIGAVTAWLKSYTNTPALDSHFVECNGQTLSDAGSVYNGQVIPNLNGNANFLYGKANSGDTKSEDYLPSHDHVLNMGSAGAGVAAANAVVTDSRPIESTTSGTAWVGYSVVWIMRVK